jgi:hypothetical protein
MLRKLTNLSPKLRRKEMLMRLNSIRYSIKVKIPREEVKGALTVEAEKVEFSMK